ncbi:MAG: VOC family protein [Alphaproteobacteria bacterium]|nr:VOC family protein [Alphaproteobacteria bacterium]
MIHHISLGVKDIERSRAFYDRVLEPLGFLRLIDDGDNASGYGAEEAMFWITRPCNKKRATVGNGTHVAFDAPSRAAVEDFHTQALLCGADYNGAPGLRPDYGQNYFAAYVIDPDGHKIEAVITVPDTDEPEGEE